MQVMHYVPLILMHIRREFKQLVPATDLGIFLLPIRSS